MCGAHSTTGLLRTFSSSKVLHYTVHVLVWGRLCVLILLMVLMANLKCSALKSSVAM